MCELTFKYRSSIPTVRHAPTAQHVQAAFVWGALYPIFLALPGNGGQGLPQSCY